MQCGRFFRKKACFFWWKKWKREKRFWEGVLPTICAKETWGQLWSCHYAIVFFTCTVEYTQGERKREFCTNSKVTCRKGWVVPPLTNIFFLAVFPFFLSLYYSRMLYFFSCSTISTIIFFPVNIKTATWRFLFLKEFPFN